MKDVRRTGSIPKDPFSYGRYILDPEQELAQSYADIVDRSALLANIGDGPLMRLEQNSVFFLTHMIDMARRDKAFMPAFRLCYYYWRGELSLTRALKGKERMMHGAVGTSYNQEVETSGYGANLRYQEEQAKPSLKDILTGRIQRQKEEGV